MFGLLISLCTTIWPRYVPTLTICQQITEWRQQRLFDTLILKYLHMHTHYSTMLFCQGIHDTHPSLTWDIIRFLYIVRFSLFRCAMYNGTSIVDCFGVPPLTFYYYILATVSVYRNGGQVVSAELHQKNWLHCGDVIMGTMASQITSLAIVYTAIYSGTDQRKHQSSASLAFVRGIHRSTVNSPHKWPVTRKLLPFDDVIMCGCYHFSATIRKSPSVGEDTCIIYGMVL